VVSRLRLGYGLGGCGTGWTRGLRDWLKIGGDGADVEEGHEFGIFGAFDNDSFVGIDPLSKASGGFEFVLGDIVEEDRAISLEDLMTD
jgi:hypothetical protein